MGILTWGEAAETRRGVESVAWSLESGVLGPRIWSPEAGLWSLESVVWCSKSLESGIENLKSRIWIQESGKWSLEPGVRSLASRILRSKI